MNYTEDSHLVYQTRASTCVNLVEERIRQLSWKRRGGVPDAPTTPNVISAERRQRSLLENDPSPTFLYLAYGSNLSNETFRGNRGIEPLSQTNVQIPELRLTFDLPGIAYSEPCFANTARRDPEKDSSGRSVDKGEGLHGDDYHKDRWNKGLIGVVYEVTATDYAHIIATEGGGSSYQDILVDCYPFATSDPTEPVPQSPSTQPFKAHTLFAPAVPPGEQPPRDGGRLQRPDTAYAQASARYLKLLADGAAECRLPYEYQDYLHGLRPYTITSNKQRLGQFVFLTTWLPFVILIFALQRIFTDDRGLAPSWLKLLSGALFEASWASYDGYFKSIFGDGERTVPNGKDGDDEDESTSSRKAKWYSRRETGEFEKGLLEV